MEIDWTPIVVAFLGGGGIAAILTAFFQRAKYMADARKVEAEAHRSTLEGLQEFIDWQKRQIERYQNEVGALREKVSCLEKQSTEDRVLIQRLLRELEEMRTRLQELDEDFNHQMEVVEND